MNNQKIIAPMTKEEFLEIPCFAYIDKTLSESVMQEFDSIFAMLGVKPDVYSYTKDGMKQFFVENANGKKVFVDWKHYRTWDNTFHLRFKPLIKHLGFKVKTPFIEYSVEKKVAQLLREDRVKPKALTECFE